MNIEKYKEFIARKSFEEETFLRAIGLTTLYYFQKWNYLKGGETLRVGSSAIASAIFHFKSKNDSLLDGAVSALFGLSSAYFYERHQSLATCILANSANSALMISIKSQKTSKSSKAAMVAAIIGLNCALWFGSSIPR